MGTQPPYFLRIGQSSHDRPLFIFLPGMDETGKELIQCQIASLEGAFDLRCFIIPADELESWNDLSAQLIALTQAELNRRPRSKVYLCGESFGGNIALKVISQAPQLFTHLILVNSASSFHRVPWLNLSSLLLPWTPNFLYQASSYFALPFLAQVHRLSSTARNALLQAVQDAPKKTAEQRLEY